MAGRLCLMPSAYVTHDDRYAELKRLAFESLNVRDENDQRVTSNVKLTSCPLYIIMEVGRLSEDARLKTGAVCSALMDYGLDVLKRRDETIELLDVVTEVKRDNSLNLPARDALWKMMGSSRRPMINPSFPNLLGEPECLQFRAPVSYQVKMNEYSDRLGLYVSTLGVIAMGQGLLDLADNTLREDLYELLQLIRDEFLRLCIMHAESVKRMHGFYTSVESRSRQDSFQFMKVGSRREEK